MKKYSYEELRTLAFTYGYSTLYKGHGNWEVYDPTGRYIGTFWNS